MTKRKKKIEAQQVPSTSSNDIKLPEWTKILPQFYDAIGIVFFKKPYIELSEKKHGIRLSFLGLFAITVALIATHLAIIKAPYSTPVAIYLDDIKPFLFPEFNFKVIAVLSLSIIAVTCISFWVAAYVAKKLAANDPHKLLSVQYLVFQIVNAGSITYLAFLLLALGTIFLINWQMVWIILDDYLVYCVTALPFLFTLYFLRVLKNLNFTINTDTRVRAFLLAAYITVPTAVEAVFVHYYLNETARQIKLERKEKIANARKTPVPAEIQTCEFHEEKISCLFILRPNELQDFELIGNWNLSSGYLDQKSPSTSWRPQSNSNTHFQLVSMDGNKSQAVELSIQASEICINKHSTLNAENALFNTTGRRKYIDEKFTGGFAIKVRNQSPTLQNTLDEACSKIE